MGRTIIFRGKDCARTRRSIGGGKALKVAAEHGGGRSEVMNMAKLVRDGDSIENLNDALHDLYFEIPQDGFTPIDGKISIEFWDRDHVIDPVRTTRYKLMINRVVSCDNRGDLRVLPGLEAELNVIKFDPPKKRLRLIGVHPYELRCQVEELSVELQEIALPEISGSLPVVPGG